MKNVLPPINIVAIQPYLLCKLFSNRYRPVEKKSGKAGSLLKDVGQVR